MRALVLGPLVVVERPMRPLGCRVDGSSSVSWPVRVLLLTDMNNIRG